MVGELTATQIVALANSGSSAEQIANSLELPEAEVRLVLASTNQGAAEDRDINDEQLAQLRDKAFRLAMHSDDDNVSARMTMFLIERDKPRLEKTNSPLVNINNAIIAAQAGFQNLVKEYSE